VDIISGPSKSEIRKQKTESERQGLYVKREYKVQSPVMRHRGRLTKEILERGRDTARAVPLPRGQIPLWYYYCNLYFPFPWKRYQFTHLSCTYCAAIAVVKFGQRHSEISLPTLHTLSSILWGFHFSLTSYLFNDYTNQTLILHR